ncbi:MAG: hypothetical protein IIV86_04130 [Bacteroidaceae bacterium]|nr:hypothetical protein [Bacteroidaceae bacterium]
MKKRNIIYIATLLCLTLASCLEKGDVLSSDDNREISVSAVVDEIKNIAVRSEEGAYIGTVPSAINNLEAAVWFSLQSGYYPEELPADASAEMKALSAETNVPIHGEINYKSGTATFPESDSEASQPKYPTTDHPVYCVGLYPQDNWTVSADGTKATHALTGTEDIMFAPEISGKWNRHFTTQRFRHMLTWIKVCVCTTTTEASNYWGKLKKIILKDVPDYLSIDLSIPESDSFATEDVSMFSATTSDKVIMQSAEGLKMDIITQDVASVFCKPQRSYTLTIECENATTKDIPITLSVLEGEDASLLDYPSGLQYLLILYFHPFNVVEGVCTLNAWNAQNEDLYL